MKRWVIAILGLCCTSGLPHAQGNDPERNFGIVPTRSVWSGVYSAAQASRGAYAYADDECGVCHGENLEGDSGITELAGSDFMGDWEGESVLELVRHMHSMPIGDRDDINMVEATDLTAFLLRENHIPAGSSDLSADPRVLAAIRMESQNPAAK